MKKFKARRRAAVGCMVDSCRTCASCRDGWSSTAKRVRGHVQRRRQASWRRDLRRLFGQHRRGRSVRAARAANLDLAATAPLLCAGITTYSPLRTGRRAKGQKVGIVGLGGLGHMGVKLAHAMGAHVVLFTTSPDKTEDAQRLGAHEVVVSKNRNEMRSTAQQL